MLTQVKSSNGITVVHSQTILFDEKRQIYVFGEINSETACEFAHEIMFLNNRDNKSPINVFINSNGGEINAGLLMLDAMDSPAPIHTYCLGTAYSMAAILFAAGKERFILPHSELMLHEPLLKNGVGGNASSIRSISESITATEEKINDILCALTHKSKEEIEQATSYDHFFSAEEAVSFGLADKIITFGEIMEG